LGIDVIITDHHQPGEILPAAFAVINPNRKDDFSQLGYLSGVGVGFYFLRALKRALVNAGLVAEAAFDLRSVLDCFCIGTLTDMVPLVDDNRVLVKQGLLQLEKTQRPGLRALLEALDLEGRPLSGQDVAIRFAPKLNALSRMEMGILPIDLMMASSLEEARLMVGTVLKNNSTRVQLQGAGESEALAALRDWPNEDFVCLISPRFHKGVVGLIATKICLQKGVPTFIGSINDEGIVTGSARLPQGQVGESLLLALEAAGKHLERFGGHDAAAGFEFRAADLSLVVDSLKQYYAQKTSVKVVGLNYDIEVQLAEINEEMMRWLESLGPFGQGFESPVFCLRNLEVQEVRTLKGNHLKYKFKDSGGGRGIDGLCFSPGPELLENLLEPGSRVDLLGELQWNYFSGRKTIQLLIKDLKSLEGR
jgi:single-stranded-DNA-specific exonuclease